MEHELNGVSEMTTNDRCVVCGKLFDPDPVGCPQWFITPMGMLCWEHRYRWNLRRRVTMTEGGADGI